MVAIVGQLNNKQKATFQVIKDFIIEWYGATELNAEVTALNIVNRLIDAGLLY